MKKPIKCRIGIHKWKTKHILHGKAPLVSSSFGGSKLLGKVDADAVFQGCEHCPTVRCVVKTGFTNEEQDVGINSRNAIRADPSLVNNPFMAEIQLVWTPPPLSILGNVISYFIM